MNPKQNQQVRNIIVARGGKIVDYINEDKLPHTVISDHPVTEKLQSMSVVQKERVYIFFFCCYSIQIACKLPLLLKDAVQNKVKILFSDTFLRKIADKRINLFQIKPQHPTKRSYPSVRHFYHLVQILRILKLVILLMLIFICVLKT